VKKLVLFLAIVAVVAFSACTGKTQKAPAVEPVQTEEVTPVQEETTPDSTATEVIAQ
jgi:outer membrane biogenesis lipoprotein LolB